LLVREPALAIRASLHAFMRRLLTLMVLALASSPAASARVFVVTGHGWGHGVGMSQWGAEGLAQHDWDYRRILSHYYPGTSLHRVRPSNVRVLIAEGRARVAISSKQPFRVVDARGRSRLVKRRLPLGRKLAGLKPPLRFVPGAAPLALDGAGYRGELVVRRSGARLNVVNELLLERYLRGVVPWEMPSRWRSAALAAQAVAARTYALATLEPDAAWDLVADTRDQMYGGIRAEQASANRAIGATAGEIVTWRGEPALTYYSSTSGGRTESVHDAWGRTLPYLRSVPDPYDAISPHHSWGPWRFSGSTLAHRLGVPSVASISERRNGSGRVAQVAVRWAGGMRVLDADAVKVALRLPSTWFSVEPAGRHARASAKAPTPPAGRFVVILASVPITDSRPKAPPGAHVGRSDDLGSELRPGYWVVYRGRYATRDEAARHSAGGLVRALS
jgi:stage II sporulation protein D